VFLKKPASGGVIRSHSLYAVHGADAGILQYNPKLLLFLYK
jgi:hypothetical protein